MKTISILLLFLTTAGLYGQSPASMEEEANGLPLQSAICDVAGIGLCLQQENDKATIQPHLLWIGNQTNKLIIIGDDPIPTNTPLVFFASHIHHY